MKLKILVFFIVLSIFANGQINAQNNNQKTEIWIRNSPEIKANFKSNPFEIRVRPIDQMIRPNGKPNTNKLGLMLGFNVWKFKIFNYSEMDFFNRYWTGIRVDLNLDFFNKKFLINMQGRYFWGLNSKTPDYYFMFQFPRYVLNKHIQVGALSYGVWFPDTPGFNNGKWFVGPSMLIVLSKNFTLHYALTDDIFEPNLMMFFVRLTYRFKI